MEKNIEEKYPIGNVYVGVLEEHSTLVQEGLFHRPGHWPMYTGFIKNPDGFWCLETGKICPVFEDNTAYHKGDYGYNLEHIVLNMDSANIPAFMTKEEILDVAMIYKHKCETFNKDNSSKVKENKKSI